MLNVLNTTHLCAKNPLKMSRCVNCAISVACPPILRFKIGDATDAMLEILRTWITPAVISTEDFICESCFVILERESLNFSSGSTVERAYGHVKVCFVCGSSIFRAKSHKVSIDSPEGQVIISCIPVQQVHRLESVCLACWKHVWRMVRQKPNPNKLQQIDHAEVMIKQENMDNLTSEHEMDSNTETSLHSGDFSTPQCDQNRLQQFLHEEVMIKQENMDDLTPDHEVNSNIEISLPSTDSSKLPHCDLHVDVVVKQDNMDDLKSEHEVHSDTKEAVVRQENVYDLTSEHSQLDQDHNHTKIISKIYKRAAATSSHCMYQYCKNKERLLVPSVMREMLLLEHKLYVPASSRICKYHLNVGSWDELQFPFRDFTGSQMDDMMTMMDSRTRKLYNFSNIREMNPHLCRYWLGVNPEQFYELLSHLPQLAWESTCPSLALSILLVKLRTGDSNLRLCSLFHLPRSTLERYMSQAKHCLSDTIFRLLQACVQKNRLTPDSCTWDNIIKTLKGQK